MKPPVLVEFKEFLQNKNRNIFISFRMYLIVDNQD
jgi:hypothetical protein